MEGCFMFQSEGGVQIGFFTFKCEGCPMGEGGLSKKIVRWGMPPCPPPTMGNLMKLKWSKVIFAQFKD